MLLWAALAAIALRYLIPRWRRQPPDNAGARVTRPLSGIEPTGPNGSWTRRDHLRGAGTATLTGLALLGVSALAFNGMERLPDNSTADMVLSGIFFGTVLGLTMATVWALVCLAKAALVRDREAGA